MEPWQDLQSGSELQRLKASEDWRREVAESTLEQNILRFLVSFIPQSFKEKLRNDLQPKTQ